MAQRKRKEHRMAGDGVSTQDARKQKQKNYADSAGTDGAIEGQSLAENSTNTASHATRVAKKGKQKQIAARLTHASTELAARSQAPLPPDTTYQALLTQDGLARSQ